MGQISAVLTMRRHLKKKKLTRKLKNIKVGKADAPLTAAQFFFSIFSFCFLLICLISATYAHKYMSVCIYGRPHCGFIFYTI